MSEVVISSDQRRFNWLTIILFIGGFTLPFIAIIIATYLDKQRQIEPFAGYLGVSCELLALFFGLMSWRARSSKAIIAVILVVSTAMIGLLTISGGSSSRPREIPRPEATSAVSESAKPAGGE
jgi:hypothetical protein